MANIIPFKSVAGLPAHIKNVFAPSKDLAVAGGFSVLSIKGKTFHIVEGDTRKLVVGPDGEDAATNVELCIVAYNPHMSKVFYEGKYVEGSQDAPACYSNNGEKPEADAETPQAKQCATCPHNQWGSRITEDGKKAKACADSRRIAVARPDSIDAPMLLRVPATSLKPLGEYQQLLAERGVAIEAVVTRVSFDSSAAFPQLVFRPVGFIDEDMANQIVAAKADLTVQQIVGTAPTEKAEAKGELKFADEEDEAPAEKPAAKKSAAKKPAAKKAAPVVEEVEEVVEEVTEEDDSDDDIFAALDAVFSN